MFKFPFIIRGFLKFHKNMKNEYIEIFIPNNFINIPIYVNFKSSEFNYKNYVIIE